MQKLFVKPKIKMEYFTQYWYSSDIVSPVIPKEIFDIISFHKNSIKSVKITPNGCYFLKFGKDNVTKIHITPSLENICYLLKICEKIAVESSIPMYIPIIPVYKIYINGDNLHNYYHFLRNIKKLYLQYDRDYGNLNRLQKRRIKFDSIMSKFNYNSKLKLYNFFEYKDGDYLIRGIISKILAELFILENSVRFFKKKDNFLINYSIYE